MKIWKKGPKHIGTLLAMTTLAPSVNVKQSKPVFDNGFDSDSFPIKVDNCSSRTMTNCLDDVIGIPTPSKVRVHGISGSLGDVMDCTIKWKIEDNQGTTHTILLPNSLYVPGLTGRVLSPQHWGQSANEGDGTWAGTFHDRIELYWNHNKSNRTIPLDPGANVGILRSAPGYTKFHSFCAEAGFVEPICYDVAHISDDEDQAEDDDDESSFDNTTVDDAENQFQQSPPSEPFQTDFNLNGSDQPAIVSNEEEHLQHPQGELPRWHYCLGHLSFKKLRLMAKEGDLPKSLLKAKTPLCSGCLFGKATRRPWRTRTPSNNQSVPPITGPGSCISVDQMESSTPGLIAQLKGIPTKQRYRLATVFVDHYSSLSFVYLQKTASSAETVDAKKAFERFSETHGVHVQHYHADNGRFTDKLFREAISDKNQTLSFCGVNAHWQNGIAERRIRELQEAARTMIIHAQRRWPSAISAHLWPYAIRMACDAHASTPRLLDGRTPIELFSQVAVKPQVKHFHHFGCPAYVLNNKLQSGKKIPKWDDRARVGIYIGPSPHHARTVGLILNLTTGLASPQFHVTYDDHFETTRGVQLLPQSLWQQKTHFKSQRVQTQREPSMSKPKKPSSVQLPSQSASDPQPELQEQPDSEEFHDPLLLPEDPPLHQEPHESFEPPASIPDELDPDLGLRRSKRGWKPSLRLLESIQNEYVAHEALTDDVDPETWCDIHPLSWAASSDPDTMYLDKALSQPDRPQFIAAMKQELVDHTERKHWKVIHRSQVPKGTQILPAVWAMKRKRRIDTRQVYKWKARLNVHGGMQKYGINYWETFSPVVGWTIIRFFLILSIIFGWSTRQLDFVLAYPQADIECELYMEVPKGCEVNGSRKDYALKLLKNIYGQKQASRVWANFLAKGLEDLDFKKSDYEDCLFYRGRCVLMVYVDDTIIVGPTDVEVQEVVDLLDANFDVSDEGDLADYLGVKIVKLDNGTITLTQPHLIDSILKDLHLSENSKTMDVPAFLTVPLDKDSNGKPFDRHFDYRSVIGKLNFLEKSTRPDIAMAVHQCARFSSDPKQLHGAAVKRIGRYLLQTWTRGIILDPNKEKSLECWADAAFAQDWKLADSESDPRTAKSRMGHAVTYAECPLAWSSKIQSKIALSTTEAEYISLSTALREVIPLMNVIKEAVKYGIPIKMEPPVVHCRVFEDNSGALELAKVPKMRPRTRTISTKYHHFREHVRENKISVLSVDSQDQIADIFTKPLAVGAFTYLRKKLLGW